MKRSLIIGLLSVTCGATSLFGQGVIYLDNYQTSGPRVTYGAPGIASNGVSGGEGVVGAGLRAGWTYGFYYVVGNVAIGSDPSGNIGDPSTFSGGLTLATGAGSTAAFYTTSFTVPGEAHAASAFAVPGTAVGGGDIVTFEAVAYNTSSGSYANALWRGHSAPFTMITAANNSVTPPLMGNSMSGFSVFAVPEPSIFALAGLGAAGFLSFRRRK